MLPVNGEVAAAGPSSARTALASSGDKPGLTDGAELLKAANLHKLLPPGSNAHLVRNGTVNCFNASCQLVLIHSDPASRLR